MHEKLTRFVTERQAAELLGFSIHTLRSWRYSGAEPRPPIRRFGRSIRYPLDELREFIDEHFTDDQQDQGGG